MLHVWRVEDKRPLSLPISFYKVSYWTAIHVLIRAYWISNDDNDFGVKRLFDYSYFDI